MREEEEMIVYPVSRFAHLLLGHAVAKARPERLTNLLSNQLADVGGDGVLEAGERDLAVVGAGQVAEQCIQPCGLTMQLKQMCSCSENADTS